MPRFEQLTSLVPKKPTYSSIGRFISNKLYRNAGEKQVVRRMIKKNKIEVEQENIQESASENNFGNGEKVLEGKGKAKGRILGGMMKTMIRQSGKGIAIKTTYDCKNVLNKNKDKDKDKDKDNSKKHKHNSSMVLPFSPRFPNMKNDRNEPTIGSYLVNYSLVEKHMPVSNFSKSLPHFHPAINNQLETTIVCNPFPSLPQNRLLGFNELARMAGREQVKPCFRKNAENPHESRFIKCEDREQPIRGVPFERMSSRKEPLLTIYDTQGFNPINYEIGLPRLDLSIILFEKQAERGQLFNNGLSNCNGEFLSEASVYHKPSKILEWRKDITTDPNNELECENASRYLPSYINGKIHSRLAISSQNYTSMKMSCCEMKEQEQNNGGEHHLETRLKRVNRKLIKQDISQS